MESYNDTSAEIEKKKEIAALLNPDEYTFEPLCYTDISPIHSVDDYIDQLEKNASNNFWNNVEDYPDKNSKRSKDISFHKKILLVVFEYFFIQANDEQKFKILEICLNNNVWAYDVKHIILSFVQQKKLSIDCLKLVANEACSTS